MRTADGCGKSDSMTVASHPAYVARWRAWIQWLLVATTGAILVLDYVAS